MAAQVEKNALKTRATSHIQATSAGAKARANQAKHEEIVKTAKQPRIRQIRDVVIFIGHPIKQRCDLWFSKKLSRVLGHRGSAVGRLKPQNLFDGIQ